MRRVPFIIGYRDEIERSAIREVGEKYGFTVTSETDATIEAINKINVLKLRRADKYQFDKSATNMLRAVSVSQATAWLSLPNHTWIEFQQALNTPFGDDIRALWIHNLNTANELAVVVPPNKEKALYQARLEFLKPHQNHWSFTVITGQWKGLFEFTYDTAQGEFVWMDSYDCPFNTCQYGHARTFSGRGGIYPCKQCQDALSFWANWLYTAIRIIRREFALAPEMPMEYSTQTEEYSENTRVKVGKGKNAHLINKVVTRQVDYRLVSFEVSEISSPVHVLAQEIIESEEEAQAAQNKRANWLTLTDKNAIIWEYKQVDTSRGRLLDPTRNPRWKSYRHIDVTPHKKWIPMLKPEVKTIKQVHARRYVQKEDKPTP